MTGRSKVGDAAPQPFPSALSQQTNAPRSLFLRPERFERGLFSSVLDLMRCRSSWLTSRESPDGPRSVSLREEDPLSFAPRKLRREYRTHGLSAPDFRP